MTKGCLDQVDWGPSVQSVGSMSMAQPVRGNGKLYPGPDDTMHLGGVQVALGGR